MNTKLNINTPTYNQLDNKYYSKEGNRLSGVTRFLSNEVFNKFNATETARRMSKGDIMLMSELLVEWKTKGELERDKGIALHEYLNALVLNNDVDTYRVKALRFNDITTVNNLLEFYNYLKSNYDTILSEVPVYQDKVNVKFGFTEYEFNDVVGIIDIIAIKDDKVTIIDLKCTSTDIYKHYDFMACGIADSKYNKFFFQLDIYEKLLGVKCTKKVALLNSNWSLLGD